ncbi:YqzH family protein [Halalkalibacter alkalisediminis]|uniref:YqzH family protein n=1 Tax=Halalkalibacter alkalisediminis TaxID=935616 RepID=A0ABV6NBM3_9BACI|nr:YqzH family protein [Halalkalibacter alkalisediminis]
MDTLLIKKHIKAVAKTYTDHDFSLPLTELEEKELTRKIVKKMNETNQTDVRDIVQDVVYAFFTGQDEE